MEHLPPLSPLGRIGFIGCGRLAQTVIRAMALHGLPVHAVHSRRVEALQALQAQVPAVQALPTAQAVVHACDTVFLSVSDDAIEPVCASLRWRSGQSVVHTSGATELSALDAAATAGAHTGGWHPLHTFGTPDAALAGLPGCAVAVEAADDALRTGLQALARALGCRPFELPPGCRALYHGSAHFAGAFVVALMAEATQIWARLGIDAETTRAALLPLLRSTVASIEQSGLSQGLAGCIARGDEGTLRRHLHALAAQAPESLGLYRELSRRNIPLAVARGTVSEAVAQRLGRALDEAS